MNETKSVELSTVFFRPKGSMAPEVINLSECGPPMLSENDKSITCLYGLTHRRQGFKQVHDYAKKNELEYEIIDMRIPVKNTPNTIGMNEIKMQDIVSLARISGDVKKQLYKQMGISSNLPRQQQQQQLINKIHQDENTILNIRNALDASATPIIIHPTILLGGNTPILVANINKDFCGEIKDIHCRMKPNIKIINDINVSSNDRKISNDQNDHYDFENEKTTHKIRTKC